MPGGMYCWVSDQWLYITFFYALRGLCIMNAKWLPLRLGTVWLGANMGHSLSKSISAVSPPSEPSPAWACRGHWVLLPEEGGGWSVSHKPSLSSSPLYLFPRSSVLSAVVLPPTLLCSCCQRGERGGEVGGGTWRGVILLLCLLRHEGCTAVDIRSLLFC